MVVGVSATVVEVAALAKRMPLPGAGTVVSTSDVEVSAATVVDVSSPTVVEVSPATDVVVAPATVVDVASLFGIPDCSTGRIRTSPVRPTMSSARFWSFTPGRLMTTVSPWRMISGSATPIESTRWRMISTATVRASAS